MLTPLTDPWEAFRERLAEIDQQAQTLWAQLGLMANDLDMARVRELLRRKHGGKDHG